MICKTKHCLNDDSNGCFKGVYCLPCSNIMEAEDKIIGDLFLRPPDRSYYLNEDDIRKKYIFRILNARDKLIALNVYRKPKDRI
jgi:hypothetical protein